MAGWADSSPQRGPVLPAVRHAHVRLVSKDLHLLVEVDLQVVWLTFSQFQRDPCVFP